MVLTGLDEAIVDDAWEELDVECVGVLIGAGELVDEKRMAMMPAIRLSPPAVKDADPSFR